jgi:ABC-2 type transport system permease protein
MALALVTTAAMATGVGAWLGLVGSAELSLLAMIRAGLNIAVPAAFILGLGTLLYGLTPRLLGPILYGIVLWSFIIEIVGTGLTTNQWILDTAILTHLRPVPAADLNLTAIAWLTALAAACAATGIALFRRRDLATD